MPERAQTDRENDVQLFKARLVEHCSRMRLAGAAHDAFIREHLSRGVISRLARTVANRMECSQLDGQEHYVMHIKSAVCYVVCTLPLPLSAAASWYERHYGGYGDLLAVCWNSDAYRDAGCQILCHITYGRTPDGAWVNVSIFPTRGPMFALAPILAMDLLSPAELRAAGDKRRKRSRIRG